MNYQDINAETIDRWVKSGWECGMCFSRPQSLYPTSGSVN